MKLRLTVALVGVAAAVAWVGHRPQDGTDGAALFARVSDIVSHRFVDSLDPSTLYQKAAAGLLGQLHDPYARLFSPAQQQEFSSAYVGQYAGIGLVMTESDTATQVARVYPRTPAARAGVLAGDVILSVDGDDVRHAGMAAISRRIRGVPGSSVMVRFGRAGLPRGVELTFTRAVVDIPSVPYSLAIGTVGYIPLQRFGASSERDVEEALRAVLAKGARGVVLDLRGNGGGIANEALEIASLFLPEGTSVYDLKSREGTEHYRSIGTPPAPGLPLVVLIDDYSASASEILAGALQDHDRALIVGERSYGKGLVQTAQTLPSGWTVVLTTGRWQTPSGRSIQDPRHDVGRDSSADSAVTATAARLTFRTDGGRVLHGGGGITPDVPIASDSLSPGERAVLNALVPHMRAWREGLRRLADSLRPTLAERFDVAPAWRAELLEGMRRDGLRLADSAWNATAPYVDRLMGDALAEELFGDTAAARRDLAADRQATWAFHALAKSRTQDDLLLLASRRTAPAARAQVPPTN